MSDGVSIKLGGASVALEGAGHRAIIGRDADTCDLTVKLPAVSRRHAEVVFRNGEASIRDLGSANGTWVNGVAVGSSWETMRPGQTVHLGEQPLEVTWASGETTRVELASEELTRRIAEHIAAHEEAANRPISPELTLKLSAVTELPYRWEGENASGRLLMALPGEEFDTSGRITGALTFTTFLESRVSSILVELIEKRPGARARRRVWDRSIVLEGPWRAPADQRVHATFRLDLPDVASPSGPKAEWEVSGLVDIDWAFDVKVKSPIAVRNREFERLRDALSDLGAAVGPFLPVEPGERYKATADLSGAARELARTKEIDLELTASEATLSVALIAKRLLGSDRRVELSLERELLREATRDEVGPYLDQAMRDLGDA